MLFMPVVLFVFMLVMLVVGVVSLRILDKEFPSNTLENDFTFGLKFFHISEPVGLGAETGGITDLLSGQLHRVRLENQGLLTLTMHMDLQGDFFGLHPDGTVGVMSAAHEPGLEGVSVQ